MSKRIRDYIKMHPVLTAAITVVTAIVGVVIYI